MNDLEVIKGFRDFCQSMGTKEIDHGGFDSCAIGLYGQSMGHDDGLEFFYNTMDKPMLKVCGVELINTLGSTIMGRNQLPRYDILTSRLNSAIGAYNA